MRRPGMWAAAGALGLAIAGGAWIALWPCAYEGVMESQTPGGPAQVAHSCASMIQINGTWVIWLLLVPVALCGIGFGAVRRGWRPVAWSAFGLLTAFCVLGLFSVGLWFLPAAIMLGVAAGRIPAPGRAMTETS